MQPCEAEQPLSGKERQWLLRLARETVESAVRGERPPSPAAGSIPHGRIQERTSVFVSIHSKGDLRGCIGQLGMRQPLWLAVIGAARAVAREDPRFDPVTEAELPWLEIEISVLSPMCGISAAEAERVIEIGRHGLMISQHYHRGLLLPQVPGECGWGPREFLEQTCRKAGLHRDAWRQGASIQIFTAEVFGEEKKTAASSGG